MAIKKLSDLANTSAVVPGRVSSVTGTYTQSNYTSCAITYDVYKCTAGSGTIVFSRAGLVDILVVGGGGASGNYMTSGGGGGGMVWERLKQYVEAETYNWTVGAGGAPTGGNGGNGGESLFQGTNVNMRSGIATGGGSYNTVVARGMISGAGGHADTIGYMGAFADIGGAPNTGGTGGGGAGGNSSTNAGGIGVYSSLETGSPIGYGGGGASGENNTTQYGVTTWGAGRSGHNSLAPESGVANRGGGGGGKGWTDTWSPGSGGSGVVIVRVQR